MNEKVHTNNSFKTIGVGQKLTKCYNNCIFASIVDRVTKIFFVILRAPNSA